MTKRDLIEALADYPDDAVVDVRCTVTLMEEDMQITGVVDTTSSLSGRRIWVTLGVTE